MSSVSEQDHLNPRDPLYYAPRWLRERSDFARRRRPRDARSLRRRSTPSSRAPYPMRCAIRSIPR